MAFPWVFESNFESGDNSEWDAEIDSAGVLDFPHYTELARHGMAPYRGAYCARIVLGDTAAHTLRGDIMNITEDGTAFFHYKLYLSKDLKFTADDDILLVLFEEVEDTTTGATLFLRMINSTDVISLALGENETISTTTLVEIKRGRWYDVEVKMKADTQGAGTLDLYLDRGISSLISITSVTALPIVDVLVGVQGGVTTTTGTILFDDVRFDDAQVYGDLERYRPRNVRMTTPADHPIIGPGKFSCMVTDLGGDGVLKLYDSDGVPNRLEPFATIRNKTSGAMTPGHDIFEVSHGLYATLTGTTAEAYFSIDRGGMLSDGAMINRGLARKYERL